MIIDKGDICVPSEYKMDNIVRNFLLENIDDIICYPSNKKYLELLMDKE